MWTRSRASPAMPNAANTPSLMTSMAPSAMSRSDVVVARVIASCAFLMTPLATCR